MLDSTGLELFGQGKWDAGKHGRLRRKWRKLHLTVDAGTGEVAAHVLTDGHADDAPSVGLPSAVPANGTFACLAQVPALLGRAEGVIASVTADSAYDGKPTYAAAAARQRDRHVQLMAERGRMGWQQATGYGKRNQAETPMSRYKHLIGPRLRARSPTAEEGEVAIAVAALDTMIRTAKPVSVRVA